MKKDINHITEELMMRYVEGDMSRQEKDEFENIVSKSEYLKKRVSALKDIVLSQPLESPSIKTHNDILQKLNIDTNEDSSEPSYFSEFFERLTRRPVMLASSVSCLVITLIVFSVINSNNEVGSNKDINNSISLEESSQPQSEMADKDSENNKDDENN